MSTLTYAMLDYVYLLSSSWRLPWVKNQHLQHNRNLRSADDEDHVQRMKSDLSMFGREVRLW
jgi:hypothetical protein